ncbi:MAG: cytochrome c oxidase subunit 3 [Chloroflexota bacterium]
MATHEAMHEPEHIDYRQLGMWIFISSECIFFGTLLITFLINKERALAAGGELADQTTHFAIGITSTITFILLASSLTMVLALNAIQNDNITMGKVWLLATAILGSIFVGVQVYEYIELIHHGVTMTSSVFGSSFYTLTGFHGTHVFIGVIMLFITLGMTQAGSFHSKNYVPVEIVGLYWHFVDLVWLVLFTLVYLI